MADQSRQTASVRTGDHSPAVGWQDIETYDLPVDGTRVRVISNHRECVAFLGFPDFVSPPCWLSDEGRPIKRPTHWAPLPE